MRVYQVAISGMHNATEVTYTFDQLNYLYGNNGAGKSTAMQAIQLALLGYIPGTAKTKDAIFRHCKKGVMIVEVGLTDGQQNITVRRTWHGSKSTVHSGVEIFPLEYDLESIVADLELPIFNFNNELMNLSANKLKDWFVGFLPKGETSVDWAAELKSAVGNTPIADENLINEMVDKIATIPGQGVELVRAVNAYIKSCITFKKSEIARMQGTIQSLVHYDDIDDGLDAEIIQQQIKELQSQARQVNQYKSAVDMKSRHDAEMDKYKDVVGPVDDNPDYIRLQGEYSTCMAAKAEHDDKVQKIVARRAEINGRITELTKVIAGGGVCNYTGQKCQSIVEMCSKFQEEVNSLRADIATLDAAYTDARAMSNTCAVESDAINKKMYVIRQQYIDRDRAAAKMCPVVPAIDLAWLNIDFDSEIARLSDMMSKAGANAQYNQLMDKLTAEKFLAENTLNILKMWDTLTGANGLQTRLMDKPFEDLTADLDTYIHKMFGTEVSSHFVLSEKANSFSFGLMRGDKYIPFDLLSSGEKCMYTLALMCCIVASANTPLKLIMVDDLLDHLDDTNIDSVFEALSKIKDIQFILAGVKPCNLKNRDDVVIHVGK